MKPPSKYSAAPAGAGFGGDHFQSSAFRCVHGLHCLVNELLIDLNKIEIRFRH
jgi:hypothetical protein